MCGLVLPSAGPVAPFLPLVEGLTISEPSEPSDLPRSDEKDWFGSGKAAEGGMWDEVAVIGVVLWA